MEIYLVRHGQSVYNKAGRYTGQADVQLTDDGRSQIENLAPCLSGIQWNRVLVSPLERARETASILAPEYTQELCPWLMELDMGTWTGHTWKEVQALDPEGALRMEGDWTSAFGGGESFRDMEARVEKGIRSILSKAAPDENILIVSHAGPTTLIPLLLLDLPTTSYWHWVSRQGAYCHITAYPQEPLWFSLAEWNAGPFFGK